MWQGQKQFLLKKIAEPNDLRDAFHSQSSLSVYEKTITKRLCSGLHKVKSLSCVQLFVTPWPTWLLRPWDSPGKDTGVGCLFLLQGIFPTQGSDPYLLSLFTGRQILYHGTTQTGVALIWFSSVQSLSRVRLSGTP